MFSRILVTSPRQFYGQRWLNICLRSLHMLGVAGIGGGFLFGLEQSHWLPFWWLTLSMGVGLSLLYLWSNILWLTQLKGVAVLIKLALLGAGLYLPAWRSELFIAIIFISSLVAHAPGKVRGFRLLRVGRASSKE